jgi:hypothetical protein
MNYVCTDRRRPTVLTDPSKTCAAGQCIPKPGGQVHCSALAGRWLSWCPIGLHTQTGRKALGDHCMCIFDRAVLAWPHTQQFLRGYPYLSLHSIFNKGKVLFLDAEIGLGEGHTEIGLK